MVAVELTLCIYKPTAEPFRTYGCYCPRPWGTKVTARMSNRRLSTQRASRLRDQDMQAVSAALARADLLARAADGIRIKLIPLCEAIAGVQSAISRAKILSDPKKAAETLSAAAQNLENQLTILIVVLGRDMGDLLKSENSNGQNSSRTIHDEAPRVAQPQISAGNVTHVASYPVCSPQKDKAVPATQHAGVMDEQIANTCRWLQALQQPARTGDESRCEPHGLLASA
jgi:hypothetical protein